jgi:hypothetical protein
MEPNAERSPALALPQPGGEQTQPEAHPGSGNPEKAPARPEAAPPPITRAAPALTMPIAQPAVPIASDAAQSQPLDPGTDDMTTDALDEEWINKAKVIVEQTKSDPYLESKEISRAKADYLRIRYNKHVKVAEDSSR